MRRKTVYSSVGQASKTTAGQTLSNLNFFALLRLPQA